jgi:small subunit ribosomal protein S6
LAVNVYEGVFILDSNRYGRDPDAVSGLAPQMIEKLEGELLVSRLWEERRLAYPIKNQRKGTYWLTYFRLDATRLTTLRRQCEINESILRFLILKVDPRIVDALVAHAQAAPIPAIAPVVEEPAVASAVAAIPAEELAEVPDAIGDIDDE